MFMKHCGGTQRNMSPCIQLYHSTCMPNKHYCQTWLNGSNTWLQRKRIEVTLAAVGIERKGQLQNIFERKKKSIGSVAN